jgi:hypothetical protein
MVMRATFRRHFNEGFTQTRAKAIELSIAARGMDKENFTQMLHIFKDTDEVKNLKDIQINEKLGSLYDSDPNFGVLYESL